MALSHWASEYQAKSVWPLGNDCGPIVEHVFGMLKISGSVPVKKDSQVEIDVKGPNLRPWRGIASQGRLHWPRGAHDPTQYKTALLSIVQQDVIRLGPAIADVT